MDHDFWATPNDGQTADYLSRFLEVLTGSGIERDEPGELFPLPFSEQAALDLMMGSGDFGHGD